MSLHHLILIKALPLPGGQPPALSTRVYQQDRLPHGKCELSAGERGSAVRKTIYYFQKNFVCGFFLGGGRDLPDMWTIRRKH